MHEFMKQVCFIVMSFFVTLLTVPLLISGLKGNQIRGSLLISMNEVNNIQNKVPCGL